MRAPAGLVTALFFFALPCAIAPRTALAQPVSFQLKNDVPFGQKPMLNLQAVEAVSDIRLTLTRDDGASFEVRHAALARGQKSSLVIGDGAAGKAHYTGALKMLIAATSEWWSYDLTFDTVVRAQMTLKYDLAHLDLPGKVLRFQQSRPAGKAELTVIGDDGETIGHGEVTYSKEAAGTWLAIPWTEDKPGRVLMLRLRATSAEGLAAASELTPWSVDVEHEDVLFDTDSSVVRPSEAGKLDASLARIRDIARHAERFIKVKLYVAGHTDTVGGKERNLQLSQGRARAIADYFRQKGLAIAIAYQGFGEEIPAVPTADEVDEPRNRRADYVLGAANMEPPFSSAYRARADWKTLK